MQEYYIYFLGLLFFAVFLVSQALLLPTAGKRIKNRTLAKRIKESQVGLDNESRTLLNEHYLKSLSPLDRKLVGIGFFSKMKNKLELAGLSWSLTQVIVSSLILQIFTFLFLLVFIKSFIIILVLSFFWWILLFFYVMKKAEKRLILFEEQFPEALDIMKRMLIVGSPITQAFNEVGNEMSDPIAREFKNTFNLLNYGYDLRLAIMQMVERNPTVSMFAFSSAVLLQKETGGNLAENLDKVSMVLRGRFKLARKIKTLSAESRLSSWILILVPFVIFVLLNLVNPDFMAPLYDDPRGIKMVMVGVSGIVIGALWIRKIINFEV